MRFYHKFLFLSLFVTVFLTFYSEGQESADKIKATTFILVRHAEKTDDATAIYSTPYKRTVQTVQQIADDKTLKIKTYDPLSDSTIRKDA